MPHSILSLHKRKEQDCTRWLEHLIFPLHHTVLLIKNNSLFVASKAYTSSLSDILVDFNQIKLICKAVCLKRGICCQ